MCHNLGKKIWHTLNPGMVAHACNSSIQEAEAGILGAEGQSRLFGMTVSKQTEINKKKYGTL
jgi:hypothetical protein